MFAIIRIATFALLGLLCFAPPLHALDAGVDNVEQIATELGFTAAQRWQLYQGEIVATDLPETADNMLAQVVALVLPVSVDKMGKRLQSGSILESPRDVIAFGKIDPKNPAASLANVPFIADEIERLKAGDYDDFNLSAAEVAAFKAVQNQPAAVVESTYRRLLSQRAEDYFRLGLAGIQPYRRAGGKTSRPGQDLKVMTESMVLLDAHEPALYQAFLQYPKLQVADVETDFFWIKKWAGDRPVITLAHRIIKSGPDRMVVLRREFYVGHSFNAEQWVAGFFPLPQGTIFFSANRTTSDRLAGFGSSLRHKIGRDMMRDELVKRFNNLRRMFAR